MAFYVSIWKGLLTFFGFAILLGGLHGLDIWADREDR